MTLRNGFLQTYSGRDPMFDSGHGPGSSIPFPLLKNILLIYHYCKYCDLFFQES